LECLGCEGENPQRVVVPDDDDDDYDVMHQRYIVFKEVGIYCQF
jgi:hypothetical protein